MRRPSAREIASQNQYLLRTHQQFRIAAEYLAQAFSEIEAVEKVETSRGKIAVAGDVLWWQEQQEQKIDRQQLIDKTDPFVKNMAELRASREKLLNCADFIIPGHGKMFRALEKGDITKRHAW